MRRRQPRPPRVTPADLEQAALAYLERFASSAGNLERVLRRRLQRAGLAVDDPAHGEAVVAIAALIARYRRSGLLDDRLYAEAHAASLSRRGLSRRAIAQRLSAKGVGADETAAALAGLAAEHADTDLLAALTLARRKRLGPFRAAAERSARRDRDLATLGRAGFGYTTARRVVDAEDTEALEAEARGEGGR